MIRVFVSHSTWLKEEIYQDLDVATATKLRAEIPRQAKFRRRLCDHLKRNEVVQVVVDEEIPSGKNWHSYLFGNIGSCQVAIVLVNEQALRYSDWVDTEIKIFGFRAHQEKSDFCLLVVPFGGITCATIESHQNWAPVSLTDFQFPTSRDGLDESKPEEVERILSAIEQRILEFASSSATEADPWLVARLIRLLGDDLDPITNSLEGELLTSGATTTRRRQIAHALYQSGPQSVIRLWQSPECPIQKDSLKEILEIVNTHWVDMTASAGLLAIDDSTHDAIAINGGREYYTPKTYIRQVCDEIGLWPVFTAPKYGPVDSLRSNLCELLHQDLSERCLEYRQMGVDADAATLDPVINELLSGDSVPIFLSLKQSGGGDVQDLVGEIRDTFPSVRLIICTETEGGTHVLPPNVRMLQPELCLDAEAQAYEVYRTARTRFL